MLEYESAYENFPLESPSYFHSYSIVSHSFHDGWLLIFFPLVFLWYESSYSLYGKFSSDGKSLNFFLYWRVDIMVLIVYTHTVFCENSTRGIAMTIDEYEELARKDLDFSDITKLDTYAILLGAKVAKWAKFKYNEERERDKAKAVLDKLYRETYKKFVYHNDYEGQEFNYTVDKKNLDIFLKTDKVYQECEYTFKGQEEKVDFVESVMNTLANQSFLLNIALKAKMYASGDIDM